MPQRPLRLSLGVYLAFAQAGYKLVWLQINQFHLIGPVKHAVGYALAHHYSGHGGNHIVEAFQMLHVNRGPYGYARLKQLLHILKALEVAAALRVGVGKLVHKGDFRLAGQHGIHIKFVERDAPVLDPQGRHGLKTWQQGRCFRPWVWLHIAHNNAVPLLLSGVGRSQHGICLAHASRIAKKYFEQASGRWA